MRLPAVVVATGLLAAAAAPAQERAEATVNASVVGVEDLLEFTVSVPEIRGGQPEMPPVPGFDVLGSQMLTSTSIVNGRVSASISWTYRLRPLEVGEFTLPPVPVPGYAPTEPVIVTVEPGSRRPPSRRSRRPDPFGSPFDPLLDPFRDPFGREPPPEVGERDLFVRAEISDREVRVGEQVLVLYRLYARVPVFTAVPVELAQPEGFWVEETPLPDVPWQERGLSRERVRELRAQPGPRREQRVVDGVSYDTYPVLLRAVFPTGAGERQLPGPRFEIGVPGRSRSLFLAPTTVVARDAPPVTIRSLPLPDAGRPADFSGAVGTYRLEASLLAGGEPVGDEAVPAGEPLVLRVELDGQGNVRAAGIPALPEDPGFRRAFRFFDPESRLETGLRDIGAGEDLDAFRFGGRRIWEFPVVPEAGGVHRIAALGLEVFDPESAAYETVASDPLRLRVEGGIAAVPAPSGAGVVERLGDDIRYLQPVGPALASPPGGFPLRWWILLSLGLPIGWNLAVFAVLRRRRHRALHADRFRRRGAGRAARKRLAKLGEDDPAAIGAALRDYAADRLGLSPRGLTPAGVVERFVAEGADPEAAAEFAALWSATEAARFAARPAGRSPADATPFRAIALVRRLEATLGRAAA